ncbi:MAG: glycosyltransferase family 9 protein [Bacteroides sp.]|jgi:ADP-heptose:LPS heptosyltransferase|nr:glycosyltransferase family 9 protein [Bacteroides sp.]
MVGKIKILVVRFSSIGDIVLTTPVVRALKNTPGLDAEVHFATKKAFAGVVMANPHIDKVHLLEDSLGAMISDLKKERFDYIIDLHHNLRSTWLKLRLMRPSRAFNKLNVQKWLLTRLKINRLPDVHIVDRYLEAGRRFHLKNDYQGLDYYIPEEEAIWPDALPETFRKGYAGFVIGGMHATKRLPNQKIIDICRRLKKPLILLGGPEDAKNGRIISAACGDLVFNGCGQFSLNTSAFLVQQARVVLTHDTGLMHIAAAFQKPIISIWGNTIPEFGMYPYMPQHPERSVIVEVEGLPCRPCDKIGYDKCPKGHFDCMEKISHEKVADAALKFF